MKTQPMKSLQDLRRDQREATQAFSTAVGHSTRMWAIARRAQQDASAYTEVVAREKAVEEHDRALQLYTKIDVIRRCRRTLHELSRRGRRRSA